MWLVDAPRGHIPILQNKSVLISHHIRSHKLCFSYRLKTIATPTVVASTVEEGQCHCASDTVAEVEQHQKDLCLTRLSDEARLKHSSTGFGFGRRTKQVESRSQKSEANKKEEDNQWKVAADTTLWCSIFRGQDHTMCF